MADYKEILRHYWGYDSFRGIQEKIISSIESGKDTLGLMPTGGGKSITFQVPALAHKGTCLVISPLIALMKDQVDGLRDRGIQAYALYSGQSHGEVMKILENCILGDIRLLYVSPERLKSELFLSKLKRMRISFITVDEAHCISQWGYDFRPDYLKIAEIRKLLPNIPVLALTATATPKVVEDIQDKLEFREKNVFSMSFMRQNLSYIVRRTDNKKEEMTHILNKVAGSAIVYVRSRGRAKELADYLVENAINASFYHAGLDTATREKRQEEWQSGEKRVIVATNAFGMGIDKTDVRMVIHYDSPSNLEAYFQEAGRAGRDGEKSYAVLLFSGGDDTRLRKRIEDTYPPKEFIRDVYDHLAYFFEIGINSGRGHVFELSLEKFCMVYKYFPIRVDAALHILKNAGYIDYEPMPDTRSRLKFILSRDELYYLKESSEEESRVTTTLLRRYSGLFTDYRYIDESVIASDTCLTRDQIYMTLRSLHKRRIVDFQPRKNIPYIKYNIDRIDGKDIVLSKDIYDNLKSEFSTRIESMILYLRNDYICRSQQLLGYFGEYNAHECGMCDICISSDSNFCSEDLLYPAKEAILNLLSDNEKHSIVELKTLLFDEVLVKAALQYLIYEEYIYIDGIYIFKN